MKGVGEEGGEVNGGLTGREEVSRVDLKRTFFIEACHGSQFEESRIYRLCMTDVDVCQRGR